MSYAANKVTEGTQTAIFGIRHLFEEFWNKLAYVFNKIKWGLFVQFILIVFAFILGILHRLGLARPVVKCMGKTIWLLIKFVATVIWFGFKILGRCIGCVCGWHLGWESWGRPVELQGLRGVTTSRRFMLYSL